MPVSVTPTLSSTSGYLIDVRDQVMSFLRFLIMNPGWTSSLWEDELVSFRKISAAEDADRRSLVNTLSQQVTTILSNKFADYGFDCSFTTEDYDSNNDDGRYTIKFDIIITSAPNATGEVASPAIVAGRVSVDENTNDISLQWERSEDTASFLLNRS